MTDSPAGRILVALEDVDSQDAALQFACAEATRRGCDLLLVHMLEDRPGSASTPPSLSPSKQRERGQSLIEDAARRARLLAGDGLNVEAAALQGPVVRGLVELSRDVDLVVVQQRMVSRMQRLLTGSVTAELAGQTVVPTVSVPGGWAAPPSGTRHIAVGVDAASAESAGLLRQSFDRAAEVGADLTLAHAWQMSSGYDDALVEASAVAAWRQQYVEALERELIPLRARYPDVPVTVEIQHMQTVDALVLASRTSDLLIVGRGRLVHPLISHLGSVTRAIMRVARCPVEITTADQSHPATATSVLDSV